MQNQQHSQIQSLQPVFSYKQYSRMKPAFSHGFLSLLLIFSSAAESSNTLPPSSTLEFPWTQVEKMIKQLNLFPELDVNIAEGESAVSEPELVERRIRFPHLSERGATVEILGHHAGYFRLPHTRSARNNRSTDPVVVWLTGGPGCSGSVASFYENGPFHLADNLSLIWNDFGWDKVSNLIYVDQPIGTGFSYTSYRGDIRKSTEAASVDFYDFLQAFFRRHPRYAKNDFYIAGESYAGHYIPAFSVRIHKANRNKKSIYINIKYYDIRKRCEGPLCYNFSNVERYLNQEHVRTALGVRDIQFLPCNSLVYTAMIRDFMKNFAGGIPALLQDGVKLLVYAGEYDLICNWLGNLRWVAAMKWYGQKDFQKAPSTSFVVDGVKAGWKKSHGPLTFLKVYNAGHMVPMDQPKASLEMLTRWMQGQRLWGII
ncbi:UNVERIFIED_CONTAM: Serine carboxypeptidase-like 47 [Sesamum radiatum]|uniref:Carboxypeptidase n=1 Tax=Sesamum radiatum TaxID=300843 RepID=A0AAW2W4V6_SESRA